MYLQNIPMDTAESRKAFICGNDSGIYDGTNVDGEKVYIFLEKGKGMTVKTIATGKPKWFQCVDYDGDGNRECDYVEPAE